MMSHRLLERQRSESCLSDLMLDRWLADEPAIRREGEAVRSHLAACRLCRDRLRALETEPAVLPRAAPPPGAGSPRPVPQVRTRRLVAALSSAAALAAGLTIVVALRQPAPPETAVRGKGDLQLDVVVRRADGRSESVLADDTLSGGDVVGFLISTPEPGYPFILGLDAAG